MFHEKIKTYYPVTVDEVKSHLNMDKDIFENDSYIENIIIKAATRDCEKFIGKDISLTSNSLEIDDFSGSELIIDEANLISIDNIISDSSTLITDYTYTRDRNYFTITFRSTISSDPIKIQFTTGYEEGDIPENLKLDILMKCADYYDVERSSYTPPNYKRNEANGIDIAERRLMKHRAIRW